MPETTVSLRWVIPFMRVTVGRLDEVQIPKGLDVSLEHLADPAARITHRMMMQWLEASVRWTKDPCLGLHAAEHSEVGDFGPVEHALRTCATLREAIFCGARHMYLMHGAQEVRLIEKDGLARWELRITDGVPQPPAANDFAVTCARYFTKRYINKKSGNGTLREVHLQHTTATSESEYARIFGGAVIKLGAAHNALVFDADCLDAPMTQAHAGLHQVFEQHASDLIERIRPLAPLEYRLRELVLQRLGKADLGMASIARSLEMSPATLRRHLREGETTFSALVDKLRCEQAEQHLAENALPVSEIAHMLGFAHTTAFYKAFRRWTNGQTPVEYRDQTTGTRSPRRRRTSAAVAPSATRTYMRSRAS